MIMSPGLNSKAIEKRQANQVLDLLPIGEFVNTQHAVRGMVWAYNNSLILVEDFAYDGLGFGVYIQVATEGETIQEWVCNISFTTIYCDLSFDRLIRYFHESRITNLRFFNEILHNICYDFFFNCKLRKKVFFGPIRNFFSFSTAETENNSLKKMVNQIGENI